MYTIQVTHSPAVSAGTSSSFDISDQVTADSGTMIDLRDPLTRYFEISEEQKWDALNDVLENPPTPGTVVTFALRSPGIRTQDRAVELLGRLGARTLQFAMQYADNEPFFKSVYANKVWEIVIGALGLSEGPYVQYSVRYVRRLLASANPVQRLAAFDALESLEQQ